MKIDISYAVVPTIITAKTFGLIGRPDRVSSAEFGLRSHPFDWSSFAGRFDVVAWRVICPQRRGPPLIGRS